jgi:hypothetical protein
METRPICSVSSPPINSIRNLEIEKRWVIDWERGPGVFKIFREERLESLKVF